jgi:hypothetical protein
MNFLIGFHGQRRGKPEPGRPDQGVRRLHPLPPPSVTAVKIQSFLFWSINVEHVIFRNAEINVINLKDFTNYLPKLKHVLFPFCYQNTAEQH